MTPARRSKFRFKRAKGFSLAELIVVVLIMAIMAGMAIPYVSDTDDMEATSAARMLACDLQYAQNVAITTQTPITVTFSTSEESYALSKASGMIINPMNKSDYRIDFSSQRGFESVDLYSANFGGGCSVTFDELGAPDNAGKVVIQVGSHLYEINVAAATGRVTVAN